MDESTLMSVTQFENEGMLSIQFQFELEGMGKPSKYRVTALAIEPLGSTFFDLKGKLCKSAKKLQKRHKRNERKNESKKETDESHTVESEQTENGNVQENQQGGLISSLARTVLRTLSWAKAEEPKKLTKAEQKSQSEKEHQEAMEMIDVSVLDTKGAVVDEETETGSGFAEGNTVIIQICDDVYKYIVHRNIPSVRILELSPRISTGFLQYPRIELDFCEVKDCKFDWFVNPKPPTKANCLHILKGRIYSGTTLLSHDSNGWVIADEKDTASETKETNAKNNKGSPWKWVSTGLEFTPTSEHEGYFLALVCSPRRTEDGVEGCPVVAEATKTKTNAVFPREEMYPYERRHKFTKESCNGNTFRVVQYNILAEIYSDTCNCRDFRYCYTPPFALTYAYRRQLLLDEILGYNTDLICLQEVDCKAFDRDWLPVLSRRGYAGAMVTKAVQVSQGVATFYREDCFELVQKTNINTAKHLASSPESADLLALLRNNPTLCEKALHHGAAVLFHVLRHKSSGRKILVANTHLKATGTFAHVRVIQIMVALQHIAMMIRDDPDTAVILSGDLNAMPYSAAIELLKTNKVTSMHADWFIGGRYDYIGNTTLEIPEPITSLQSAYKDDPVYTNYVSGYQGTLDYVFYETSKLKCTRTLDLPSHEEVTENSALPSVKFPSDHLSLVCELQFQEKDQ